jgi:acylphosphatase
MVIQCGQNFSIVYEISKQETGSCNPGWNTRQTIMVTSLQISGRVQGVGFRYQMAGAARGLGITGWVRNRRDGSVEAMVEGTPDAVAKIIAWARHGPPHAVVAAVEISEGDGSFSDFELLPTM